METFIIAVPAFLILLSFIFGKKVSIQRPYLIQDMIRINSVYLFFNLIYGIANDLLISSTIILVILIVFLIMDSILPIKDKKIELLDANSSVTYISVRYGTGWYRKTIFKTSIKNWKIKNRVKLQYYDKPKSYNAKVKAHIGKSVRVKYMSLSKRLIKISGIKNNKNILEFSPFDDV